MKEIRGPNPKKRNSLNLIIVFIEMPILLSSTIFIKTWTALCVPRPAQPNFFGNTVRRAAKFAPWLLVLTNNHAMFWIVFPVILSSASCGCILVGWIVQVMIENMSERMMFRRKLNLLRDNMFTSEVPTNSRRWVHVNLGRNEFPTFCNILHRSRHLEVVDVHCEQESKFRMPEN